MKPSIPSLPEGSAIKYLEQVFHVRMGACSSFDEAITKLNEADICIPGLMEDEPILVPDRMHLHAAIYNLKEGSTLATLLEAFIGERYGGAYLVMGDATFTGKDSLFLLSVSVDQSSEEAYQNNIKYMPEAWGKFGNPVAHIVTGGCRMSDGDIMSVAALQLSSVAPR